MPFRSNQQSNGKCTKFEYGTAVMGPDFVSAWAPYVQALETANSPRFRGWDFDPEQPAVLKIFGSEFQSLMPAGGALSCGEMPRRLLLQPHHEG